MARVQAWKFRTASQYNADRARVEYLRLLRQNGEAGGDLFSAELIFGELLANAVQHAPGFVEMAVRWSEGETVLCVDTFGPPCLPPKTSTEALDEHGRGLQIVAALSKRFSIKNTGRGCHCESVLPIHSH